MRAHLILLTAIAVVAALTFAYFAGTVLAAVLAHLPPLPH